MQELKNCHWDRQPTIRLTRLIYRLPCILQTALTQQLQRTSDAAPRMLPGVPTTRGYVAPVAIGLRLRSGCWSPTSVCTSRSRPASTQTSPTMTLAARRIPARRAHSSTLCFRTARRQDPQLGSHAGWCSYPPLPSASSTRADRVLRWRSYRCLRSRGEAADEYRHRADQRQ